MKNLLYIASGILALLWVILVFGYKLNGLVDFLLVGAFFLFLLRLFNNKDLTRRLEVQSNQHSTLKQKKTFIVVEHSRGKVIQLHPPH